MGEGCLHVKWDGNTGTTTGNKDGEENHRFVPEELYGEDAVLLVGEDLESLLETKDDEERTGDDEGDNDVPAVPWVENTAEGDTHDTRNESANDDDSADPVDLASACLEWCPLSRVEGWEQKDPHW